MNELIVGETLAVLACRCRSIRQCRKRLMSHKIRAYFMIRGDFDPAHVIETIGLKPTEFWKAGEKNRKPRIPRCSMISYGEVKRSGEIIDLYDIAEEVLRDLRDKETNLNAAIKRWDLDYTFQVALEISLDGNCSMPALGLSTGVIGFLGSIGASLDIDSYRLSSSSGTGGESGSSRESNP